MARLRTRREERSRKLTFKIFAGMFDYVATIAGALIAGIIGYALATMGLK